MIRRKVIAIFVTLTCLLFSGCKSHEVVVEKPVVLEKASSTCSPLWAGLLRQKNANLSLGRAFIAIDVTVN